MAALTRHLPVSRIMLDLGLAHGGEARQFINAEVRVAVHSEAHSVEISEPFASFLLKE